MTYPYLRGDHALRRWHELAAKGPLLFLSQAAVEANGGVDALGAVEGFWLVSKRGGSRLFVYREGAR